MRRLSLFVLICGVIITIFALSVVADGSISKVVYSDSNIYFDGSRLQFNSLPVLVVGEDEEDAKTYVPIREFFESMGYTVNWSGEDRSIHILSAPPEPVEVPEPTPPLGETTLMAKAGEARLFLMPGAGRGAQCAMLTYEDLGKSFDWQLLSPRMQYPEMYMMDIDGDGEHEIVIKTWPASGTGVFFNELHVVEVVREAGVPVDLAATTFNTYLDFIDKVITYETENTEDGWLIRTICGEQEVTARMEEPFVEGEIRQVNMRGGIWICEITLGENGFHLSMPLCIVLDNNAIPTGIARFNVDFKYTSSGGFEFGEPVISEEAW